MVQTLDILKTTFGYDTFRPLQQECIDQVLQKKDTLLIMPTGGGKSLCYQIPALIFEGMTVVISPLISLMKDQVGQLEQVGVAAAFLNSTLTRQQYGMTMGMIRNREIKILFLAPETVMKPDIQELITSVPVDCFTVDEAHCISEWGHDFRPEYRELHCMREILPNAVCLAMTATATPRVREDIKKSLHIHNPEFLASFNRTNLFYEVIPKDKPFKQTVEFIKRYPDQSGIIYCFSRNQVDTLAALLKEEGLSVLPYHAGMSDKDRTRNQELFIRDDVQIMVATIAFGMGINKPNVRFVIHYDLPKNPESYYQETGRAGRDGLNSHCLLLFGYADIYKIKYINDQKQDELERTVASRHLSAIVDYAESKLCRRVPLMKYFGEEYLEENCKLCDNCVNPSDPEEDVTEAAQKFFSCVFRMGERFGMNHVIDVLRGSESKKVIQFRHHEIKTYGIGKEFSANQWKALVRQWLHKGVIKQDDEIYGVIKLTEQAWNVMQGNEKMEGFIPAAKAEKQRKEVAETRSDYDRKLFQLLREERKRLADKKGIPPYMVFPDKALIEMASYYPQSYETFSKIFGVGAKKLEQFGSFFIELITEYCEEYKQMDRLIHP